MLTTPDVDPNRPAPVMNGVDRSTTKQRVLIVDDHALVRAGFKQLIDGTEDLEVVGEAGTAAAALELVMSVGCDVVLLDISLPDASVLETVALLRRRRPNLPVLIVSMHPEEQYAVNLLRAGASGFFPKAGEAKDLLEAIRVVAAGRKYISPALAEVLALEAAGNAPEPPHRQLSNREFQIFVQLACGKTVTQIASEVHLSVKTISTYRTRIMQKMNCSRNADLTAYALQHNLMGWTREQVAKRHAVRVFLVEDSPLIRKRIVDSLDSIGGFEVIGFSESEEEAVETIADVQPDVVITDIRLKQGNGIEVVRQVRLKHVAVQPKIYVLSNYAYPEYKRQCELVGADDFFDKSSEYDRFLDTLQQVA